MTLRPINITTRAFDATREPRSHVRVVQREFEGLTLGERMEREYRRVLPIMTERVLSEFNVSGLRFEQVESA